MMDIWKLWLISHTAQGQACGSGIFGGVITTRYSFRGESLGTCIFTKWTSKLHSWTKSCETWAEVFMTDLWMCFQVGWCSCELEEPKQTCVALSTAEAQYVAVCYSPTAGQRHWHFGSHECWFMEILDNQSAIVSSKQSSDSSSYFMAILNMRIWSIVLLYSGNLPASLFEQFRSLVTMKAPVCREECWTLALLKPIDCYVCMIFWS
jgi:hypothetical protein